MQLGSITDKSGAVTLLNLTSVFNQGEIDRDKPTVSTQVEQACGNLTTHVSGVILEPINGFEAIEKKAAGCGLVLSLAQTKEETSPIELPVYYPNWGVEFVRQNYGLAHLKLFYHPQEELGADKLQVVAEIYDHCLYEGIELVLELSLFALDDKKNTLEQFQESQLLAAQDMRDKCHLMVLEYPHSALACATLTAQLDVPWLLIDRTPTYSEFKEQVRTAMESGAKGVVIGDVVWQGVEEEEFEKFCNTTARDRVIEIARIAQENMAPAK
jgi:tagatose-1,6-bisphosphate aldolase